MLFCTIFIVLRSVTPTRPAFMQASYPHPADGIASICANPETNAGD